MNWEHCKHCRLCCRSRPRLRRVLCRRRRPPHGLQVRHRQPFHCRDRPHSHPERRRLLRLPRGRLRHSRLRLWAGFPAQRRVDTHDLVVYQVWLNYYAQNSANGQASSSVLANAQAHLADLAKDGRHNGGSCPPFNPLGRGRLLGHPMAFWTMVTSIPDMPVSRRRTLEPGKLASKH